MVLDLGLVEGRFARDATHRLKLFGSYLFPIAHDNAMEELLDSNISILFWFGVITQENLYAR